MDPDFGRPAEVVVEAAESIELPGEPGVLQREALDFPTARTVFF
jgi:hypothetical protein